MGAVQDIVTRHDIMTNDGFQEAMREMETVPPAELHFILAYDTGGQSRNWKQQHALANELPPVSTGQPGMTMEGPSLCLGTCLCPTKIDPASR